MQTNIRKETSSDSYDFPAVMTKQTLAELLGVSPRTITAWVSLGRLKAFRPTQRVTRFRRSDVLEFLDRWTA
ncbi:MAG: helix-turn-helix domain-containing protein [Candidatus Methylacidiphilaceae bacterium]